MSATVYGRVRGREEQASLRQVYLGPRHAIRELGLPAAGQKLLSIGGTELELGGQDPAGFRQRMLLAVRGDAEKGGASTTGKRLGEIK